MGIQTAQQAITNEGGSFGSKNKLINGDFSWWQRASTLSATAAGGQRCADRWLSSTGASPGAATFSRQSATTGDELISPSKYYFRHNQTVGNTSNARLQYYIEDVSTFAGKKATLSFWAKSNVAISGSSTQLFLYCHQFFGSGSSSSPVYVNTTVAGASETQINHVFGSLTTSWQKFTLTLEFPKVYGKSLSGTGDDAIFFEISMPNSSSSTPTYIIDFAQFQFEEGPVATAFERRPIQTELALCQRYYETGYYYAHTNHTMVRFVVPKRSSPSITHTESQTWTGGAAGTAVYTSAPGSTINPNSTAFVLYNAAGYIGSVWQANAEI